MAKLTLSDITSGYAATTKFNSNNTLIEAALENTLSRDGTSPNQMLANLDLNSNRIVNLGVPNANSDAARLQDVIDAADISISTASLTTIVDSGGYYSSSNVEGALQEVGVELADIEADRLDSQFVYFKRTAAEIAASVTPTNFFYNEGHVRRYGATGDWNGTTGTDDTTAFRNACLVIQTRGSGALDLGYGRYRLYSDGSTTPLGDFSNLRGITIRSDGAELVVDRTFSASQTVRLFQFTACNNIAFRGPLKGTCTQIQPVNEKALRGAEFATFLQGCNNVSNELLELVGFRLAWHALKQLADPDTYISKGFNMGVTKFTSGGYGWTNAGDSGWAVTATLITDVATRSYFPQGGRGHTIKVISKNFEASVDCLLANTGTNGIRGLKLWYINTESTFADSSKDPIRQEHQDSDLFDSVFEDIEIHLNIVNPSAGAYMGPGFISGKVLAAGPADTVDRGHTQKGIKISGYIKAGSTNQRAIEICATGTWSTGEFVDNICIENLRLEGTGQPNFNLAALQNTATFRNVYSSANMNVVGNTTSLITMVGVESDAGITVNTADTSHQAYFGCKFGSLADQSNINKSFIDCKGLGTGYTGSLTGCTTVPTGTIAYSVNGDLVTIVSPNIQGTADAGSTAATVTGMPAIIRPQTAQLLIARTQNSGTDSIALVRIETTGVITLLVNIAGSATFTNSGTKGFSSQVLSYRLK